MAGGDLYQFNFRERVFTLQGCFAEGSERRERVGKPGTAEGKWGSGGCLHYKVKRRLFAKTDGCSPEIERPLRGGKRYLLRRWAMG